MAPIVGAFTWAIPVIVFESSDSAAIRASRAFANASLTFAMSDPTSVFGLRPALVVGLRRERHDALVDGVVDQCPFGRFQILPQDPEPRLQIFARIRGCCKPTVDRRLNRAGQPTGRRAWPTIAATASEKLISTRLDVLTSSTSRCFSSAPTASSARLRRSALVMPASETSRSRRLDEILVGSQIAGANDALGERFRLQERVLRIVECKFVDRRTIRVRRNRRIDRCIGQRSRSASSRYIPASPER